MTEGGKSRCRNPMAELQVWFGAGFGPWVFILPFFFFWFSHLFWEDLIFPDLFHIVDFDLVICFCFFKLWR